MNEAHTNALVEAAPLLYRLYGITDSGWSIQHGFACGDGWFDIIMRLSVKMEAELQAMLGAGKRKQDLPVAQQVKEKFGKLRFHVGGQPAHWRDWTEEAMAESGKTCELCGQPGSLGVHHGWYRTLCSRHRMLSGYIPDGLGEIYFLGSEECPDSREEAKCTHDGLAFKGFIKLSTNTLVGIVSGIGSPETSQVSIWAAEKSTTFSRAVIYAGDLPPALWPALSKLANEQGQIPVAKAMQYLNGNRWHPNVRAVLGLSPVFPADFVEEAERMIRHEDMELVGSVVLRSCSGAAPVFEPFGSTGIVPLRIVPWQYMPGWAAEEFRKWHFGAQHPLGPYLYDFQAWVRAKR